MGMRNGIRMALQHPKYPPRRNHLRVIPEHSDTFGCFLASMRKRVGLKQTQAADLLREYFMSEGVSTLNHKIYGNLERDDRYPTIKELGVLFRGMVEGWRCRFSSEDCHDYVELARE